MKVRSDHIAGAVENSDYFVRGNKVSVGTEERITKSDGVGFGDSDILDPHGEIVICRRRHVEDFFFADIDPNLTDKAWGVGRANASKLCLCE